MNYVLDLREPRAAEKLVRATLPCIADAPVPFIEVAGGAAPRVTVRNESWVSLGPDFVWIFEDRISPFPEIQVWVESQRSATFTYEETVLQCLFALEYQRMQRGPRPSARFVWEVMQAEVCRFASEVALLRVPSYSTFLRRISALGSHPQDRPASKIRRSRVSHRATAGPTIFSRAVVA